MLLKLADALRTRVYYRLHGNYTCDDALASNRLFNRCHAIEQFNNDDPKALIKLIDAMLAKQPMQLR